MIILWFFALQMLVVWQTQPMWSLCRRRPRSPWQSMRGCSTPANLSASAAYCCASLLCAPCQPTSSPSSSSCDLWARHQSRHWSETCSYQGAPSAGPTHRDSEPCWLQSGKGQDQIRRNQSSQRLHTKLKLNVLNTNWDLRSLWSCLWVQMSAFPTLAL